MNDPRKLPGWKQLRAEVRNELLMGAILDALLPAPPVATAPPPVEPVKTPRRSRSA